MLCKLDWTSGFSWLCSDRCRLPSASCCLWDCNETGSILLRVLTLPRAAACLLWCCFRRVNHSGAVLLPKKNLSHASKSLARYLKHVFGRTSCVQPKKSFSAALPPPPPKLRAVNGPPRFLTFRHYKDVPTPIQVPCKQTMRDTRARTTLRLGFCKIAGLGFAASTCYGASL